MRRSTATGIMLSVLLFGCASSDETIKLVDTSEVEQHPELPATIYCAQFETNSLKATDDGTIASKSAVFNVATCNEEILRYVRDAELTMCYYREDLNEPRCANYADAIRDLREQLNAKPDSE